MDWNKSNTILIIAFIVLNIFLFTSSYNDIFSEEYDVTSDKEFIGNVENILMDKNIVINCDLPEEAYMLNALNAEYEIIHVSKELLTRFLGPGIEPIEDVTKYSNDNGEILEIKDSKKLCYNVREKNTGIFSSDVKLTEIINKFIEDKNINIEGYSENYRHVDQTGAFVAYTKKHNEFSLDNSYMYFYFDSEGIYKFEKQNIISVKETAEKIRTFTAAESLPRLLSYNEIENKEIVDIEMTYYSVEDENWQFIFGINSYPVWKVIFNDGTQKHLTSITTYAIN